jgi:hypothetical protein
VWVVFKFNGCLNIFSHLKMGAVIKGRIDIVWATKKYRLVFNRSRNGISKSVFYETLSSTCDAALSSCKCKQDSSLVIVDFNMHIHVNSLLKICLKQNQAWQTLDTVVVCVYDKHDLS